jgi:hypothetical protein
MKKVIVGCCLALSTAVLAQAPAPQDAPEPFPVSMTYCIPGESCLTCESEMPLAEVNALLETKLKDVEVLLFKPDPGGPASRDWKWYETGEIFSAVVEFKNSGKGDRSDPPACRDRAPLKGSIQPRDGVWTIAASAMEAENCPGIAEVPASTERETLRFEKPFRGLLAPDDNVAEIIQVSPNSFMGRRTVDNIIGETLLEVHSPESLKLFSITRSKNPASACMTRVRMDLTWIGEG